MNEDHYIKLTLAVYRVTELFPETDPLRYKIRESSSQILADLILTERGNPGSDSGLASKIKNDIDILDVYFELAQFQNWLDKKNFLVLRKEYSKIKENLKIKLTERKQRNKKIRFSSRQIKILEILKREGKIQIGALEKKFPRVSRRTLNRDLDGLIKVGQIKRQGKWSEMSYLLSPPL